MGSKIGKGEWIALYFIVGAIDFIQLVIIELILVWFFGIGAAINEILDPIVGAVLALYLQMRGVNIITNPKRLLSLIATEAAEAISGGAAQLWVLDVWYIHSDVKKEEAAMRAMMEQEAFLNARAGGFNRGGMRRPDRENAPLNQGGMRLPQKKV